MSALALPVRQGTDAWLAARRDGIGSSDAPIIAGERGSLVELWGDKTGLVPRPEPDAALAERWAWGHRLEDDVAEAYTERTGRSLRRVRRLLRHPERTWALASLDRVSARRGERRIVECKITAIDARYADGDVPGDVLAQVQHQLWVTGYEVADVAVLEPGWRLGVYEVGRDEAYIADLEYLEADFWRCVETQTMPPVDGSETARRFLARRYPRELAPMLAATVEHDEIARRLRLAMLNAKQAEAEADTLKNAMRALIGDAEGVEGDGWRVTWRKAKDSQVTDWVALADALLPLSAPERDALIAKYTETREGARFLRPWWKEEA